MRPVTSKPFSVRNMTHSKSSYSSTYRSQHVQITHLFNIKPTKRMKAKTFVWIWPVLVITVRKYQNWEPSRAFSVQFWSRSKRKSKSFRSSCRGWNHSKKCTSFVISQVGWFLWGCSMKVVIKCWRKSSPFRGPWNEIPWSIQLTLLVIIIYGIKGTFLSSLKIQNVQGFKSAEKPWQT